MVISPRKIVLPPLSFWGGGRGIFKNNLGNMCQTKPQDQIRPMCRRWFLTRKVGLPPMEGISASVFECVFVI